MYGGNSYWLLDSVSYIDSFVGPYEISPGGGGPPCLARERAVHDMYMYMIKYMCMCMCMYMYVHAHVSGHAHVHACVCMCMCVHVCVCVCVPWREV